MVHLFIVPTWIHVLSPPVLATFKVGQEHSMAQALVADLEDRQPIPVEEQEQGLDPRSHRLHAVGRQADRPCYLGRPSPVQACFASQKVSGRKHRRWVPVGEEQGQVGGSTAGGDQTLDLPVWSVSELPQRRPSHARPFLAFGRVGEKGGGEHARPAW